MAMLFRGQRGVVALLGWVGLLSFVIVGVEDPTPTMDFYTTTAQVIPVLMLVLTVEMRFFEVPAFTRGSLPLEETRRITSSLMSGIMVIASLLVAEGAALWPLMGGRLSEDHAKFVVPGLVVGFLAVAILAFLPARAGGSGARRAAG